VGIRHLSFTLGDQKVWYRDLPDIEERIRRLGIPDDEELWSWGYCRRSSGDYEAHVAGGFTEMAADLAAEGVEVDAVLGCAPFQNSAGQFAAALTARVLPEIAAGPGRLRMVDDRECVNVLQALAEARELIQSGHEHVLVLAAEKVEEERSRFRKYSVFSDFCLALLLSGDLSSCGCEILDVHIRADRDAGEDTSGILTRDLEKECVESLLASHGVALGDVGKFFYLSLFQPIAEMKGKDTGFAVSQLYTDLAKDFGHCYGADPFINMQTYFASGGGGETHVLCASGRERAGVSLVRRLR
jgi:3-oxoacyl-[acyl-carrier-protein] synthase-3